jgi:hypothetical protein
MSFDPVAQILEMIKLRNNYIKRKQFVYARMVQEEIFEHRFKYIKSKVNFDKIPKNILEMVYEYEHA